MNIEAELEALPLTPGTLVVIKAGASELQRIADAISVLRDRLPDGVTVCILPDDMELEALDGTALASVGLQVIAAAQCNGARWTMSPDDAAAMLTASIEGLESGVESTVAQVLATEGGQAAALKRVELESRADAFRSMYTALVVGAEQTDGNQIRDHP